ncbi:unnamed protein product [Larinioides sclopetarius]|uniref:Uncharacterized protein n=1 Tax=Larinioides sclopetarius TaxID=280406 RepID=A0AAV2AT01_9ARAC
MPNLSEHMFIDGNDKDLLYINEANEKEEKENAVSGRFM